MTPIKTPPGSVGADGGIEAASDRVHKDMEGIFRRAADRPPPGPGPGGGPPRRRRGRPAGQVAALAVFGCALGAYLAGALASVERGGAPADAGRAAASPSAPGIGPAAGTAPGPEAPRPPRREAQGEPAAATVRADAPAPPSPDPTRPEPEEPPPVAAAGDSGEAVVRAFYDALGRGDGEEASAHVVAEKRSSRAFSPQAISRFYGALPEPLRLTAVAPLGGGAYRVSYRYSAGRSRCDGGAVVRLARRDGRDLIRSIDALNGC